MEIRPGQLVVTLCEFAASEIPVDWADEQTLPMEQRKTIRQVKINPNEVLLAIEEPVKDVVFSHGIHMPVTRWVFTFLRGSSLCFMVTVVGLDDYFCLAESYNV